MKKYERMNVVKYASNDRTCKDLESKGFTEVIEESADVNDAEMLKAKEDAEKAELDAKEKAEAEAEKVKLKAKAEAEKKAKAEAAKKAKKEAKLAKEAGVKAKAEAAQQANTVEPANT